LACDALENLATLEENERRPKSEARKDQNKDNGANGKKGKVKCMK
jgi:hypothetical protein